MRIATMQYIASARAEMSPEGLAKMTQNPVANLISVPFQLAAYYNAARTDDGPSWQLRFQVQLPLPQVLVKNPINRYLINSPMLSGMKKNADGSLTLHIQKDSPGKDKEANWLPAPDGPIYLVMRLYWPKTEAPSILPPGEGTWQPPAVVPMQ